MNGRSNVGYIEYHYKLSFIRTSSDTINKKETDNDRT